MAYSPPPTEQALPGAIAPETNNIDIEKEQVATSEAPLPAVKSKGKVSPMKRLAILDRFLALWIVLSMGIGIILGYFVPNTAEVLDKVKFVGVSLPLAMALILMMWPILCRVSPSALLRLFTGRAIWYHLAFSLFVNWVFAPLLMLGLAWAFLPDRQELREGLILVGIARCIAMVMIWTDIAGGDSDFCAVLVAFNSLLQIVLYAPFGILYINVIAPSGGPGFQASYSTVAISVAAFLGIPLALALLTRGLFFVFKKQKFFEDRFLPFIAPLSLIALLFTNLIVFAAQGREVVNSITSVLRVMAPLIVYFCLMFFSVLFLLRWAGIDYRRTTAQAFTGASNNFELAIAVAVAAYGAQSPQALAATVGPLVEVPILLGLAYLLVWFRKRVGWDLDDDDSVLDAKANLGPNSDVLERDLEKALGLESPVSLEAKESEEEVPSLEKKGTETAEVEELKVKKVGKNASSSSTSA